MARYSHLLFATLAVVLGLGLSHPIVPDEVRGYFVFNDQLSNLRTSQTNNHLKLRLVLDQPILQTGNLRFSEEPSSPTTTHLDLDLKKDSAWTASSRVVVRRAGGLSQEQVVTIDPNCHYSGKISNAGKSLVTMDLCEGVTGLLDMDGDVFSLQEEVDTRQDDLIDDESDDDTPRAVQFRLTRVSDDDDDLDESMKMAAMEEEEELLGGDDGEVERRNSALYDETTNTRGANQAQTPVVEMGAYVDRFYLKKLESQYQIKTTEARTKHFVAKYNRLRSKFYDEQFPVFVQLKYLELWENYDPPFYNLTMLKTAQPGAVLNGFCKGKLPPKVDVKALHYDVPIAKTNVVGLAWVSLACHPGVQCMITKQVSKTSVHVDMHELGHQLGLPHNNKAKECTDDPGPKGFMGGWNENWQECYRVKLRKTVTPKSKKCLYEENLPDLPVLNTTPKPDSPIG